MNMKGTVTDNGLGGMHGKQAFQMKQLEKGHDEGDAAAHKTMNENQQMVQIHDQLKLIADAVTGKRT